MNYVFYISNSTGSCLLLCVAHKMMIIIKHFPIGDCAICNHSPLLLLTHRQVVKNKVDLYVIDRVKEKRLEKDLSQADLAYELGMSVGFIGKVESPKYTTHYNIKHLNDLAKILKCSPQDFLPKRPL
jgi:hypothetical protein